MVPLQGALATALWPGHGVNHLVDLMHIPFRKSINGYLHQSSRPCLFSGGLSDNIRIDVELQVP
jgi:hypothetical protein